MSGSPASTAGLLVQPGLFGRAGAANRETRPGLRPGSAMGPSEEAERQIVWQARVEAVICGRLDVIAGMSGSLLSHDALDELWQRPDPAMPTFAADKPCRHLRAWHAGVRARLGPTATARTIFDSVAEPLLRSLGFDISVVQSAQSDRLARS